MSDHEARARRLAERIQVIVAETIERRVKDPRMGFVTITDVRVTGDLREATVFYTVLDALGSADGSAESQTDTAAALESAKGMLRTEVGRQTGIRHTPSLAFVADAIPENARHIDDLLRRAHQADDAVHERAASATYAGDADPYRHHDEGGDADEDDGHDPFASVGVTLATDGEMLATDGEMLATDGYETVAAEGHQAGVDAREGETVGDQSA